MDVCVASEILIHLNSEYSKLKLYVRTGKEIFKVEAFFIHENDFRFLRSKHYTVSHVRQTIKHY